MYMLVVRSNVGRKEVGIL